MSPHFFPELPGLFPDVFHLEDVSATKPGSTGKAVRSAQSPLDGQCKQAVPLPPLSPAAAPLPGGKHRAAYQGEMPASLAPVHLEKRAHPDHLPVAVLAHCAEADWSFVPSETGPSLSVRAEFELDQAIHEAALEVDTDTTERIFAPLLVLVSISVSRVPGDEVLMHLILMGHRLQRPVEAQISCLVHSSGECSSASARVHPKEKVAVKSISLRCPADLRLNLKLTLTLTERNGRPCSRWGTQLSCSLPPAEFLSELASAQSIEADLNELANFEDTQLLRTEWRTLKLQEQFTPEGISAIGVSSARLPSPLGPAPSPDCLPFHGVLICSHYGQDSRLAVHSDRIAVFGTGTAAKTNFPIDALRPGNSRTDCFRIEIMRLRVFVTAFDVSRVLLNGVALGSGEGQPLEEGDRLSVAGVQFTARVVQNADDVAAVYLFREDSLAGRLNYAVVLPGSCFAFAAAKNDLEHSGRPWLAFRSAPDRIQFQPWLLDSASTVWRPFEGRELWVAEGQEEILNSYRQCDVLVLDPPRTDCPVYEQCHTTLATGAILRWRSLPPCVQSSRNRRSQSDYLR